MIASQIAIAHAARRVPSTDGDAGDLAPLLQVLRALLCIAIGVILYCARAAFIPIALAVLFALILSGPIDALRRRGVPRGLSAVLMVIALVMAVSGGLNVVWQPAQHWLASAPRTVETVKLKIRPVARILDQIQDIKALAAFWPGEHFCGSRPA